MVDILNSQTYEQNILSTTCIVREWQLQKGSIFDKDFLRELKDFAHPVVVAEREKEEIGGETGKQETQFTATT